MTTETTFDVIRGHRLVLWAKRLNFQPDFIELLDKNGTHYVEEIQPIDEDAYTLIVLAKLRDRTTPFSIMFTCNEEQLKALVERVQLENAERV